MKVLVPSKSNGTVVNVLDKAGNVKAVLDNEREIKQASPKAIRAKARRKSHSAKGSDGSDADSIMTLKRSPLHRSQSGHADLASAMLDEWSRSSRRNRRRSTEVAQSKLSEIKNRF